ncbi:hypothetical protein Dvina_16400 [Dactylosporangium vinaceum]|uniref:Integral membrane protein n=1 Tax=Dactylosporangium vinaceum TaxID=53362 RepID=A0ABV5M919_9ACTN|nr:hypothetical protein [Dactylosporangium vinaceum]UAB99505.1 hypothetical protein Dvina_16400 [Dactylosporangium vinaceum]
MRFRRGLCASAAVAAAGGLSVWAGWFGSAGWWRVVLVLLAIGAALAVMAFLVPVLVLGKMRDSALTIILTAAALVVGTAWLTAADIEVRSGEWQPVVVTAERCAATDGGGCEWNYRVTVLRTETDLGWITCDVDTLNPGDRTRVRADPHGEHRPSLEPCAHTWPGYTTVLHVVWAVWAVLVVAALPATGRLRVA